MWKRHWDLFWQKPQNNNNHRINSFIWTIKNSVCWRQNLCVHITFDVYYPIYIYIISQIESRNICVFLSGQVFILCSSDCTWSTFYDDFLSFCDRAAYGQIIQTIRDRAAVWSLKEFVLDLFFKNRNWERSRLEVRERSLITNCQLVSLDILTTAPALTRHPCANWALLFLARLITW